MTIGSTRCGSRNKRYPTYSYQFHPIIVLLAVVWRVVVVVALGYFFLVIYFLFPPQRSFFLYYLTSYILCLRFGGFPMVLDIELSVSARHQKTRVLLCAWRIVLLLVSAASGGVRHKFQYYMQ